MEKKYSNKYLIETGIGLQAVDNLKNSEYFLSLSKRYINEEIPIEEFDKLINSYYENKPEVDDRNEEADKVSSRIGKIISEDSFTFSTGQFLSIHKSLFNGLLKNPGKLRDFNFSKKEWVLNGESVTYGDYRELESTLQYDFEQEKKFSYKNLSMNEIIEHLAIFIANLWQIHPFEEGNTRTVAVFVIKYLRSLGFDVTNDVFAKNAWYFRNALVRANYSNLSRGIYEDRSYLEKFLENLLLNKKHELKNRNLRIFTFIEEKNRESEVIFKILDDPYITSEELAKDLEVSIRTIKNVTKALVDKKIISRVNGKRFGYWKISKSKKFKK